MNANELLSLLCCPETRQELSEADQPTIHRLNEQAAAGTLKNRGGEPVKEPMEGGLVRSDGKYLYPIRRNIPIMLTEEAIPLA